MTWIQKIIRIFSIWFFWSHSIEFSSILFTQSLFQKKCKHWKHFIWKKMVETWWNSCSKYFFSTIWSFILFNQNITYLVLGVNKLKGNKSKQQIFDMNSKNDTSKMYWPKILTSFNHFLANKEWSLCLVLTKNSSKSSQFYF